MHIQQVTTKSGDRNALWRYFGLTQRASPAEISNPTEAKLDLLIDDVNRLAKRSYIDPDPPPSPFSLTESRAFQYENLMEMTLKGMGYNVTHGNVDAGFDLLISDVRGRTIFAELKYLRGSVIDEHVASIIRRASSAPVPVLLITYTDLTDAAREAVRISQKPKVVQWRGENDNDRLHETLRHMFASM